MNVRHGTSDSPPLGAHFHLRRPDGGRVDDGASWLPVRRSDVGLVRWRLSLALLTMLVTPLVFLTPVVSSAAVRGNEATLVAPTVVVVGLGLIVFGLAVWMARQVLQTTGDLDDARARLQRQYEWARLESLRDPLTGLGNHRAFQEELARQIDESNRYASSLALVLIDLDDFKRVNDTEGHAAGDELLSAMGRLMTGAIRRSDRAFRVGGDEFAIIMPNASPETASHAARRLLAAALEGYAARGIVPFSFSAGVSAVPMPSADRHQLYRHADAALYWAKHHGRTTIGVFDPLQHGASGDSRTTPELSAAVGAVASSRALRAAYQPIFNLTSGVVVGYEGFVRPQGGSEFRDTGSLFRAAEATGRTVELDIACLRVVAAAARDLTSNLSVNVSPRTLETEEFSPALLENIFTGNGISPSQVIVELTEREAVEDIDRLRRNLSRCQEAGMRIAADDVGAGNAGLRLLSQIRFDIVKIDLSLVQGGVVRDSSLAVLRSIRDLAVSWNAMVIAEGIETPEQLSVVRSLGMSAAQGYFLGMPSMNLEVEPLDLDQLLSLDPWPFTLLPDVATREEESRLKWRGRSMEAAPGQ
jgi:diguanylate cyclase (GGDEF)-like protein